MDIAEIAKLVRAQLKKEFPECKFSVRIERFSMGQALDISLMRAPFRAFARSVDVHGNERVSEYAQLNHFQLRWDPGEDFICNGVYLTSQVWAVMKRADEIQGSRNWDNSDSQVDYFDVNFYYHSEIGRWDKPFEVA